MGATTFTTHIRITKKTSTQDAFKEAKARAQHSDGHGGYTGTIAEKHGFDLIVTAKSKENATKMAEAFFDSESPEGISAYKRQVAESVVEKHGPAGAIRYPIDKTHDGVLFFGWASD